MCNCSVTTVHLFPFTTSLLNIEFDSSINSNAVHLNIQAAIAVASATMTPLNVDAPANRLVELVAKVFSIS